VLAIVETLLVCPNLQSFVRENVKMKYKVVLRQSEEGYSVSVAGLPGCWSQGATEQEAIENIKDAIREYLAALNDSLQDAGLTYEEFRKLL
jgi:predicted RNase H-like HicB family nuclease